MKDKILKASFYLGTWIILLMSIFILLLIEYLITGL